MHRKGNSLNSFLTSWYPRGNWIDHKHYKWQLRSWWNLLTLLGATYGWHDVREWLVGNSAIILQKNKRSLASARDSLLFHHEHRHNYTHTRSRRELNEADDDEAHRPNTTQPLLPSLRHSRRIRAVPTTLRSRKQLCIRHGRHFLQR